MRKLFILLVITFVSYSATAQGYYIPGQQVSGGGITFNVTQPGYSFVISNAENSKVSKKSKYLDGTEVKGDNTMTGNLRSVTDPFDSIMLNTFTYAEYNALKSATPKHRLMIIIAISNTGEVLEVKFMVAPTMTELLKLPPEKFALLEKNIKKFTRFNIEGDLKNIQFVSGSNLLTFTDNYPIKQHKVPITPGDGATKPDGNVIGIKK